MFALAEALKISEAQAVGHLHFFWWWAMDNAPDGVLLHSERAIARAGFWEGDPEEFVAALVAQGWIDLDKESGKMTIHDWFDFAGKYAVKRVRDRERLRVLRGGVAATTRLRSGYDAALPIPVPVPTAVQPLNPPSASTKTVEAEAPLSRAKKFEKPTPAMVTTYAKERGFTLDGQAFCDFYEAKGWVIGKSPMRNWQAAVRTWEQRHERDGQAKKAKEPPRIDGRKVMAAIEAWKPGDKDVAYEQ